MQGYFDLHCDTVSELLKRGGGLHKNAGMLDLERSCLYEPYIQVCALYTEPETRGEKAYIKFKEQLALFQRELAINPNCVLMRDAADIKAGTENNKRGLMLSLESASPLEGGGSLSELYRAGIRIMSLTHNGENDYAYGAECHEGGLKPAGRILIERMEEVGIILDLSHLSKKGFYEVCGLAGRPFIATHSNSDFIYPHRRGLSDDMFREIVSRKGICGINLHSPFVAENAGIDDVIRHIEHYLDLGGEDTVSIGADLDGTDSPVEGLDSLEKVIKIADRMVEMGYNKEITDKLFYKNALNFFENNLKRMR